MDYIYLIIDYDANEVEYATEDLTLAQEILFDLYMEAFYYEFIYNTNHYGFPIDEAYKEAKRLISYWFREYVVIEKVPKSK